MPPTVYLISGSNRGIGLGFVNALVRRDNVVVFAGVRDPSRPSELDAIKEMHPGKLHIIKLVSADEAGNRAAAEEVKATAGRLDVLIANAGILKYVGSILTTPAQEMRDHVEVNVLGPMILLQAFYPLLQASAQSPKFILISSRAGSITLGTQFDRKYVSYGSSKAAVNYFWANMHGINLDHMMTFTVVVPICPGRVGTEMVSFVQRESMSEFQDSYKTWTVEESVESMLTIIDHATRLESGPVFQGVEGITLPW